MSKITKIEAREILDSRGLPTLETTVWSGKIKASASVPSGASTGVHEALELRDGDKKRFLGKGVLKACRNVNSVISKEVVGMISFNQPALDAAMIKLDGTENKSKLGANAILSVSLASSRLAAKLRGQELYEYLAKLYGYKKLFIPTPLFNVINGGVHADSGLDIQEFFIIPQSGSFSEKLRKAAEVYQHLKKNLASEKMAVGVGDEGGFAPHLGANEKGFEVLQKAVKSAGYKLGQDFRLGIDAASSEFFDSKTKHYSMHASRVSFSSHNIHSLYVKWVNKYNLQIIEDGCAEDDMEAWKLLTKELGKKAILVGDDLFVTNPRRLQMGINESMANAVLIKVNQIGTLTETLETIKLAQQHNYKTVISHRSGETTDNFIADLAVATNANFIKAGSLSRGERLSKYNRLLQIETQI